MLHGYTRQPWLCPACSGRLDVGRGSGYSTDLSIFKASRGALTPFFQGKIDNFCAIYAVLNAVQQLCKISPITARDIFNHTLLEASRDQRKFKAILEHTTDYIELVDAMLDSLAKQFDITCLAPFTSGQSPETIWSTLGHYAQPEQGRCAVFRFLRYEAYRMTPLADHWTTASRLDSQGLRLFDCSLESRGLYLIRPSALVSEPAMHSHEYVVIPAEQIRLLSLVD